MTLSASSRSRSNASLAPATDDGAHRGVSGERLEPLSEVHRLPRRGRGRDRGEELAGLVLTDGVEGVRARSGHKSSSRKV
jgi:hypothetical protein